jgi:ABC-type Mn2+/Zn2+ transport system ATPase subunit
VTDNPVIELDRVSVCKSNRALLDRITLHVSRNEFIGVIGPNGAGKTSLLNVIAGFEEFDGELRLFGCRESWTRSRNTRMRIGCVPQSFEIDPAFPILAIEAVLTGVCGRMGLFRSPGKSERNKAIELMEMMRVAHLANSPVGHLSGGERQKILLARALIQQPEILLLDEPTANLDIAVQREVLTLIGEIYRRESLAVLLVTHDFNMIPDAMQRALLLNHGKVIFDGAVGAALTGTSLSRLFEYPLETFERNGRRFVSFG